MAAFFVEGNASIDPRICTPDITFTPASHSVAPPLQGFVWIRSIGAMRTQPAFCKVASITQRKAAGSDPAAAVERVYGCGANSLATATSDFCCSSVRTLGVNFVSSSMILDCWASILDCCAALMRSSTMNKNTVQSDSIAIPRTTAQNALSCAFAECFGVSYTMPTPTAIPASTLNGINTRWGQTGSSVPAQTALMYAQTAAIVVWVGVVVLASAKLIGAIFRRKRGIAE